ncbi:hypothetical protein [Pseudoalteromonas phage KB12-38]|nr:hypothetical protein [Pseudoalteromonas phage KB12-38]
MSVIYPTFTPKAQDSLILLQQILLKNPDALTSPDCPYPKKLKDALNIILVIGATRSDPEKVQQLLNAQTPNEDANAKAEQDEALLDEEINIDKESKRLYNKIKGKMDNLERMETSEQLQLFRTATTLLEKLLNVNERASNIEKFENFKRFIIEAMDRYLTPAQKTEFVDLIDETLNG